LVSDPIAAGPHEIGQDHTEVSQLDPFSYCCTNHSHLHQNQFFIKWGWLLSSTSIVYCSSRFQNMFVLQQK